MAKQHRRANKPLPNSIKDIIRDEMFGVHPDKIGSRAWIDWTKNRMRQLDEEGTGLSDFGKAGVERMIARAEEKLAADRWPANNFALNVALTVLLLLALIVLAVATGLVKP
jgi:hypothetical protein